MSKTKLNSRWTVPLSVAIPTTSVGKCVPLPLIRRYGVAKGFAFRFRSQTLQNMLKDIQIPHDQIPIRLSSARNQAAKPHKII